MTILKGMAHFYEELLRNLNVQNSFVQCALKLLLN